MFGITKPLPDVQGPVDLHLSRQLRELLLASGASNQNVDFYIAVRGLEGREPVPLRKVSTEFSGEWIRKVVKVIDAVHVKPLLSGKSSKVAELMESVQALMAQIQSVCPGSDLTIKRKLLARGLEVSLPSAVVRLADTLGCHHDLRLTEWKARAKFRDEDRTIFAGDGAKLDAICAIVPFDMPEIFDSFINFARRFSRGAGVMAAGKLAERYSSERGVPLTGAEAQALLEPFAVHLGRHDGDEWYAFFNSANDWFRKVASRVDLFKQCSFEELANFHRRYNRSQFLEGDADGMPNSVLHAALELAGFDVDEGLVKRSDATVSRSRGISEIQGKMIDVFRLALTAAGNQRSVPRAQLLEEFARAGIRESTAHKFLGSKGIFVTVKGRCYLADAGPRQEQTDRSSSLDRRELDGERISAEHSFAYPH
jgi:hypothetical protein